MSSWKLNAFDSMLMKEMENTIALNEQTKWRDESNEKNNNTNHDFYHAMHRYALKHASDSPSEFL